MNKDRLTALIKKISIEKELSFNTLLTYFFMEMALKRINQSQFRDQFIIKGGFLLSNMVGVANRTTIDIDISVKGVKMMRKGSEQCSIRFSSQKMIMVFVLLCCEWKRSKWEINIMG